MHTWEFSYPINLALNFPSSGIYSNYVEWCTEKKKKKPKRQKPFSFASYSFYSWLVSTFTAALQEILYFLLSANFYYQHKSTEWEFEEFNKTVCFEVENL